MAEIPQRDKLLNIDKSIKARTILKKLVKISQNR